MNFKGSILGPFLMPIFGPRAFDLVLKSGSMSNNVGDNLNQQNLLNYAAASIANL